MTLPSQTGHHAPLDCLINLRQVEAGGDICRSEKRNHQYALGVALAVSVAQNLLCIPSHFQAF